MAEEILDIINEKNEVIGKKPRKEVERSGLLYRAAEVFVMDGGKIILQKRSATKRKRPGHYSVMGETVQAGETFEEAAVRGVKEEYGLEVKNLRKIGDVIVEDKEYTDRFLMRLFVCEGAGEIKFDEVEVESVLFVKPEALKNFVETEKKTTPALKKAVGMYLNQGKIVVSAPGKLMLSGEWSVLEKGVPCIVLAVDKRVYAEIKESGEVSVNLTDFGIKTKGKIEGNKIKFEKEDEKLLFTKHSIETALEYLSGKKIESKNFELETKSEISKTIVGGKEEKIGFGSSAAAVIAITGAVLKLYGIRVESQQGKEVLFKLGIIAHYKAQGKIGSGFDVAASTFGGALVYKRFDAEWLEKTLKEKGVFETANMKWPMLKYENLELPENFLLSVGFTGKGASTKNLVMKIREYKEKHRKEYEDKISAIRRTTEELIEAIKEKDETKIKTCIGNNRMLLKNLSDASKAGLETEELRKIAEISLKNGGAGKFSGAGGGDCGIGICFEKGVQEKIISEWKKNGITPIAITISKEGVKEN